MSDHRVETAKHGERAQRLALVPPVEDALTPEERAQALARIAASVRPSAVGRMSSLRRRSLS